MVAQNATRRHLNAVPSPRTTGLLPRRLDDRLESNIYAEPDAASRRNSTIVDVFRDGRGEIINVRIGRWRVLTSSAGRRIEEVRQLPGGRFAVKIVRRDKENLRTSCESWQLYNLHGRLLAALQTSSDGKLAIVSDYERRQASRLSLDGSGEFRAIETWKI